MALDWRYEMILNVSLKNWKSYRDSKLYIDSLSVLIGTNASGKSNALDAFEFLKRSAEGSLLTAALQGDQTQEPLRGGIEWAARGKELIFEISCLIEADDQTNYNYTISCLASDNRCEVKSEKLERIKLRKLKNGTNKQIGRINLFWTDPVEDDAPTIVARLFNSKGGTKREVGRYKSILSQLSSQKNRQEIEDGVEDVCKAISRIFILDPIPSHMRGFPPLSDRLDPDAGNIAGVLAALPKDRQKEIENTINTYIKALPEKEISRVYAETVDKLKSAAMLYCDEQWESGGKTTTIDARGMSDGTLRFLAIITALLTRPSRSLLIIEEVDNGLHPSRSNLLLKILREIGESRKVDVLVTTHNPALLDAMGTEMVPFITVANRSNKDGASELTLLENIDQLPKLLAFGEVGKLSSSGRIERALKEST